MSRDPQRTILLRAALVAVGCVAFTWLLQRGMGAVWHGWAVPLASQQLWSLSGMGLSACLGLLAAAGQEPRRAGDPVLVLAALALLAVQLGCVLPGALELHADLDRAPPLMELDLLFALLPGRTSPLPLALAGVLAPLGLRALWAREPLERWSAVAGLGTALALAVLLLARIHGWVELQGGIALHEPPGAGAASLICLVLSAGLAVATAAVSLAARGWLVAPAWLALLLLLPDPAALLVGARYSGGVNGADLFTSSGPGLSSSLPLHDLSRHPPRLGGEPLEQPLVELLEARGHWDFERDDDELELPGGPWDYRLQRGWHLAPPVDATVAELQPVVGTLRRFGVSLWLWPGRPAEPVEGALGPAFAQPVIPLLTFPPTNTTAGVASCWELELRPGAAVLRAADGSDDTGFAMPRGLEELASSMERCEGSVVIAPSAELPAVDLFLTLDRLAGTHAEAAFLRRVALRWPDLDPPFGLGG